MTFPWLIGAGKADITAFIPGIVMLGYGNPHNRVKYVDTPLNARAIWIENPKSKQISIMLCLEVCFITQALTDALWDCLHKKYTGLKREQLIITAQHTHSAPSGYTHYALYSMPTPGFSQEVLDKLVDGSLKAIEQAYTSKRASKLVYKEGQVPFDAEVSFNRSLKAYNLNREIKKPLRKHEQAQATDRSMRIFEFVDEQGPFASWNWFAVHCTNIIWTNQHISPGNKGYAALYLESDQAKVHNRSDYIGVFAQGNAGDVSPIFTPSPIAHWFKQDDLKMIVKAKENGMKQFIWAKKFLSHKGVEIDGDIDGELIYSDLSHVEIEKSRLPTGQQFACTSPACLGVAFMEGAENAGVNDFVRFFARSLCNFIKFWEHVLIPFKKKEWGERVKRKYFAQRPKHIFVETGEKRVLGTSKIMSLIIPGVVDKSIGYFKHIHRQGGCHEHTWTQHVLPLSIVRIGSVSLVSIPGETTTMAGKRIQEELTSILGGKVVLCPYALAYCGYLTTPEEYEAQCYEGGHTVFGKWTLPAFSQNLARLAREMTLEKSVRTLDKSLVPPQFTKYELSIRSFEASP
tara:strand:- start:2927 stop:4645 length:1719 start_codon:yes stop_codon:yes gene_type:complete